MPLVSPSVGCLKADRSPVCCPSLWRCRGCRERTPRGRQATRSDLCSTQIIRKLRSETGYPPSTRNHVLNTGKVRGCEFCLFFKAGDIMYFSQGICFYLHTLQKSRRIWMHAFKYWCPINIRTTVLSQGCTPSVLQHNCGFRNGCITKRFLLLNVFPS